MSAKDLNQGSRSPAAQRSEQPGTSSRGSNPAAPIRFVVGCKPTGDGESLITESLCAPLSSFVCRMGVVAIVRFARANKGRDSHNYD